MVTEPYIDDPDFRLYVGDVREVLAQLPNGSVDCCVTSPPYWGLRDYGTATWEGGDPGCDHRHETRHQAQGETSARGRSNADEQRNENYRDVCGRCGAARADRQIGLEQTPEQYVAEMVAVFAEVRRVLADHGTLWLNLGDTIEKKNLVGIPWRVAFALQADGWFLRSDIIWAKPNPMPESATDRPTKAHEYVFLLTKRDRYFFDQEAVREPYQTTRAPGSKVAETDHYYGTVGGNGNRGLSGQLGDQLGFDGEPAPAEVRGPDGRRKTMHDHAAEQAHGNHESIAGDRERWANDGRNVRSVWTIATQPYSEAHFATFPEALPRRCIQAGCPERVCATCGKPRERIVKRGESDYARLKREEGHEWTDMDAAGLERGVILAAGEGGQTRKANGTVPSLRAAQSETLGWTDCGHDNYRPGVVLDPFCGAGTTALVARKMGRLSIGIELNPEYAALCARRLGQQSLFA